MKDYRTGICYNCRSDQGLHQFETMQCPKNGIEENRFDHNNGKYFPQQWQHTFFEDSGIRKLNNVAPDLLDAVYEAKTIIYNLCNNLEKRDPIELQSIFDKVINKAIG